MPKTAPNFSNLKLIATRSTALSLGLLLLQQVIVASSTWWLKQVSDAIAQQQSFAWPVAFYLTSLLLPYVPGVAALIFLTRWQEEALQRVLGKFVAVYKGRMDLWSDRAVREEKTALLQRELPKVLGDFGNFVYDSSSLALNVVLNVLTVAVLVDPAYLLSFVLSLGVVAILLRFQSRHQSSLEEAAQEQRLALSQELGASWDNIVINNRDHFSVWQQRLSETLGGHMSTHMKAERFRQSTALLISIATFVPSMGVVVYLLLQRQHDLAALLAVVLTLPRLLMILNHLHSLLAQLAMLPTQRVRMVGTLERLLEAPERVQLTERTRWNELKVTQVNEAVEAQRLFERQAPGRYTVRGMNGAGKSTLLQLLKERLGDAAAYIPTQSTLALPDRQDQRNASSGQRQRAYIQDALANSKSPVLLLDEWDANLDDAMVAECSRQIDAVAQKRMVVEVRHR